MVITLLPRDGVGIFCVIEICYQHLAQAARNWPRLTVANGSSGRNAYMNERKAIHSTVSDLDSALLECIYAASRCW